MTHISVDWILQQLWNNTSAKSRLAPPLQMRSHGHDGTGLDCLVQSSSLSAVWTVLHAPTPPQLVCTA